MKRKGPMCTCLTIAILFITATSMAAPVPDTGQTECYDVAGNVITCPSPGQPLYGQDANYTINPMSYTKLDGSGNALPDDATSWVMVKDNVTGLIWEKKTDDGTIHDKDNTYTWYDPTDPYPGTPGNGTDTKDFIDALNSSYFGGYSDWRMPTIKELDSIVNCDIPYPGPKINTTYFPNTQLYYFSSTTYASDTQNALCLGFNEGIKFDYYKRIGNSVRAVRGGRSQSAYVDNHNGTVTDTSTGLMWEQGMSDNAMTWEQALSYCENLTLSGYTDWRLPTTKELRSIVDYSRNNPAINTTYFSVKASNDYWWFTYYWSSTTYNYPDYMYFSECLDFYDGLGNGIYPKSYGFYVRAVRGGQPVSSPVLSVTPSNQPVPKDAGTTTFSVSNTGTGAMPWIAAVTSGGSWLAITSGASGTDTGTIICSFAANTSTSVRTATIRVTAPGATGSPVDVTVTQAPTPVPPVLSVTPANQAVSKDAGTTTFSVSNTGTGTMPWTAAVTTGGSWLSITSGASGTDSGTFNCSFTENTSTTARTATIRVTASGATGSPQDVTVTQVPTGCVATLDENLLLHIPVLSYLIPGWGDPSYWADFLYEYNPAYPALILFKLANAGIISIPTFSCSASTLSDDMIIHIPDLLLPDGISHLWADLEYSSALSVGGNAYFLVTGYGAVSN